MIFGILTLLIPKIHGNCNIKITNLGVCQIPARKVLFSLFIFGLKNSSELTLVFCSSFTVLTSCLVLFTLTFEDIIFYSAKYV